MIIVLGHARVRPGREAQALALSQAHVARSLAEPGCIAHGVHQDTLVPGRLVFVEKWASLEALQAHFRVPASRAFARELGGLCSEPPGIEMYEAHELKPGG